MTVGDGAIETGDRGRGTEAGDRRPTSSRLLDSSTSRLHPAYVDTIEETPGPFAFAVDEEGALVWLQFLDGDYPRAIEAELARQGYQPAHDSERTAQARAELLEYCRGERQTFTLPLSYSGTAWQVAVWDALCQIPFGETRTYGQIAAALGRPRAARAMGRANATNHIPLVVPCHRVVGANGALTGFEGGLHIKARLLAHEARMKSRSREVEKRDGKTARTS